MIVAMLLAGAQSISAIVYEPLAATPWGETFKASCGASELEVRRPMYPPGGRPTVLFNGRPVSDTELLADELSEVGAAIRLSFQCPQKTEGVVYLRWVTGLVGERGRVDYRAGHAVFRDGEMTGFGAEKSNEETFWYR